jgi:RNA polymerase sigma-70 factor (ECF subfamily)
LIPLATFLASFSWFARLYLLNIRRTIPGTPKEMRTRATRRSDTSLNSIDQNIRVSASPKHTGLTQAAVEQIWNQFSTRLERFIRARVTDPATAEDILQNVFVKFQGRCDEFHDPAKIQGWLFLAARNAIIDHYRTRKPTSKLSELLPIDLPATDIIEIEELHVMLRRIIDRLPKPYREAFVLTSLEGLSREELARRLGVSVSGAKSLVQRARKQLKEMLLDFCRREFSRTLGCQPCPRGLFPIVTATKAVTNRKPAPHASKSKSAG